MHGRRCSSSPKRCLLFGSVVAAAYARLGVDDAYYELVDERLTTRPRWPPLFCLSAFYLYDLYDFVVMHDRRELVLRLLQALGLAWIALAVIFYALPQLMLGTRHLADRDAARAHPDGRVARLDSLAARSPERRRAHPHRRFGRRRPSKSRARCLSGATRAIASSASSTIDPNSSARASSIRACSASRRTWQRSSSASMSTASSSRWASGAGSFRSQQLLDLSLSGNVAIEECASFYERTDGARPPRHDAPVVAHLFGARAAGAR